jgi:hypothetical protein
MKGIAQAATNVFAEGISKGRGRCCRSNMSRSPAAPDTVGPPAPYGHSGT